MTTLIRPTACKISIIIPVLNEAHGIVRHLQLLQPLRQLGHEVIVVDGGSSDATCVLARPLVDQLCHSTPGRARQMNSGAAQAHGEALLFLHADTILPSNTPALIQQALTSPLPGWGRFDVRLSGSDPLFRMVEWMMNWRSALTGVVTGDQALFIRRLQFAQVGGFADIPLMEDIEMSKRLRRYAHPYRITVPVVTSSRRWEQRGIVATILLMWHLRLAYFLGADPALLAHRYR